VTIFGQKSYVNNNFFIKINTFRTEYRIPGHKKTRQNFFCRACVRWYSSNDFYNTCADTKVYVTITQSIQKASTKRTSLNRTSSLNEYIMSLVLVIKILLVSRLCGTNFCVLFADMNVKPKTIPLHFFIISGLPCFITYNCIHFIIDQYSSDVMCCFSENIISALLYI
jgi:hypothetical protein